LRGGSLSPLCSSIMGMILWPFLDQNNGFFEEMCTKKFALSLDIRAESEFGHFRPPENTRYLLPWSCGHQGRGG
jgi:hypothetical protein